MWSYFTALDHKLRQNLSANINDLLTPLKDFCRLLGNQIDRVLPNVIWVVTKADQVSEGYRSISPMEHLSNMYDDILKFLEASDISNEDGRAVLKVIEHFLNENNAKRFLYSKTDDRVCFDSLHKQFDLFKPLPANQFSFGEKDAKLKAVYSLVRNLDRIEENISDKEKELKREQLAFKKELEVRIPADSNRYSGLHSNSDSGFIRTGIPVYSNTAKPTGGLSVKPYQSVKLFCSFSEILPLTPA